VAHRIGRQLIPESPGGIRIQGRQHRLRMVVCAIRLRFREGEEAAQGASTVVVDIGDRLGCDGRDDRHVAAGAAEDHVQAFFAAALVDRSKAHGHPPVPAWRIAHAHQDDVAFVALDVLEILDEQPIKLAIVLASVFPFESGSECRIVGCQPGERIFDLALLGFRKGDDAKALAGLACKQFAN
jgi:hypothetical protein